MTEYEFKFPVGTRVAVNKLGAEEGRGKEGRTGVVTKIIQPYAYQQAEVLFDNGKTKRVYDDQVDEIEETSSPDDTLTFYKEDPAVEDLLKGPHTYTLKLAPVGSDTAVFEAVGAEAPPILHSGFDWPGRNAYLFSPDPISPSHYQFPGGAEVRHISEWLTANAAQALQYIARSSRIDGNNKGDAREDIAKAIKFLEFELERLEVEQ